MKIATIQPLVLNLGLVKDMPTAGTFNTLVNNLQRHISLIAEAINANDDTAIAFASMWYSNSYTPTIVNGTNVAASNPYAESSYTCMDGYVEGWVVLDINPTAAGAFDLTISLPVASAFTNTRQAQGIGISLGAASMNTAFVSAVIAGNLKLRGFVADIDDRQWCIHFRYAIL